MESKDLNLVEKLKELVGKYSTLKRGEYCFSPEDKEFGIDWRTYQIFLSFETIEKSFCRILLKAKDRDEANDAAQYLKEIFSLLVAQMPRIGTFVEQAQVEAIEFSGKVQTKMARTVPKTEEELKQMDCPLPKECLTDDVVHFVEIEKQPPTPSE